jgi:hypothetical protein
VKLTFDWSKLSKWEMDVVRELWKLIKPIEKIYREQNVHGNNELLGFLGEVKKYSAGEFREKISAYLALARANNSIYEAINSDRKLTPNFTADEMYNTIKQKAPAERRDAVMKQFFLLEPQIFNKEVNPTRPLRGGIYTGDVPEEFFKKGDEGEKFRENLINEFPPEEREKVRKGLNSPTNVVIFKDRKPVEFIPYSKYFEKETKEIRDILRKAAELSEDPTLKEYLLKRSKDVMEESCRESDIAWLNVRSKLNGVFGDVETYLDKGMGVRRGARVIMYYVDAEKTGRVQKINAIMSELEKRLPVSDEAKIPNRKIPITEVTDVLHSAGEPGNPRNTLAFMLPNDEEVTNKHGARVTMLFNAIVEKEEPKTVPMARALMDKNIMSSIGDEDLINGIFWGFLLHEQSHQLGGVKNSLREKGTDTRRALGGVYSAIEEAKADIVGLYHVPYLVEKGLISEKERDVIYTIMVARKLTAVRIGLGTDAHTDAQAMEFNYLAEKGGIVRNADGTYKIDTGKFEEGIASLCEKLLAIEADGKAEEGKKLLDQYVKLTPETAESLKKVKDIPKIVLFEYPELPAEK